MIEHDMRVAAANDWIIDIGPGTGEEGRHVAKVTAVIDDAAKNALNNQ